METRNPIYKVHIFKRQLSKLEKIAPKYTKQATRISRFFFLFFYEMKFLSYFCERKRGALLLPLIGYL